MKKLFKFGKIDFNGCGRKINAVEIEMELKEKNGHKCFSVCGDIWNSKHTDIICGGQCLDDIKPYMHNNSLFKEIHRLWKLYHLNDMNAGTKEQKAALDKAVETGKLSKRYDYKESCDYLKSIGKYEVEYNGEPYKYGHGWITYDIPDDDLRKIEELLNG